MDLYKGFISRSCAYFILNYPMYKEIIFNNIIDPYTILTWNNDYPISEFEYHKNNIIKKLQGNNNLFISKNYLLNKFMEELIDENLDIFDI